MQEIFDGYKAKVNVYCAFHALGSVRCFFKKLYIWEDCCTIKPPTKYSRSSEEIFIRERILRQSLDEKRF